jgi:GNAT superfamily N-acetyltransferase
LFGSITEDAFRAGTVHLTDEGAAVWFAVDGPVQPPEPSSELLDLAGEATGRMAELDDAFALAHRDVPPHDHLELLGVVPASQGRGVGASLLAAHHRPLDARGRAAYLDAASLDARRFYLRHGYQDRGEPFRVGTGGPLMYPMWRDAGVS